jgi:hypothetical protein
MRGRQPKNFFIYNGKTYTVKQLAVECGMNVSTLSVRLINKGWSVNDAIHTPVENKNNRSWMRRVKKAVRKVHDIIKANNGDIVWYIKQCRMLEYRQLKKYYKEFRNSSLRRVA